MHSMKHLNTILKHSEIYKVRFDNEVTEICDAALIWHIGDLHQALNKQVFAAEAHGYSPLAIPSFPCDIR